MSARQMTLDDVPFAISLIRGEGWGHTRTDLERMLSLSPCGSYVWEAAGEPCGFITSLRYDHTAIIGHLLVSTGSRGRQVGRGLVKTLLEDIDSSSARSTMLYATSDGSMLYRQFGFVDSGHELVAVGIFVKDSERLDIESGCAEVQHGDIEQIAALDYELYGDDRSGLIARLFHEFPEHCFKTEESGTIAGYAFGRRTPIGFDIGPWYCVSERREDAASLLDSVIRSFPCGGRVDISPFASNSDVPRIIARYHRYRKAERVKLMIRGETRYTSDVSRVLAVAGFELG